MRKNLLFNLICLIGILHLHLGAKAQKNIKTVGFSYKPMLTFNSIRANTFEFSQSDIDFAITSNFGYSAGMIIRSGLSKNFSLETGINFIARNKTLVANDRITNINTSSSFRLVSYEIPFLFMAFIQLSDQVFMNGALGVNMNFFPSDVATSNEFFFQRTTTKSWMRPGLMGNIGWDYRTETSGIFYIGGSWQSFFGTPFRTAVSYERPNQRVVAGIDLPGTYVTLDLRYFFHEDPDTQKPKKKKKSGEVDILWYRNQKK